MMPGLEIRNNRCNSSTPEFHFSQVILVNAFASALVAGWSKTENANNTFFASSESNSNSRFSAYVLAPFPPRDTH